MTDPDYVMFYLYNSPHSRSTVLICIWILNTINTRVRCKAATRIHQYSDIQQAHRGNKDKMTPLESTSTLNMLWKLCYKKHCCWCETRQAKDIFIRNMTYWKQQHGRLLFLYRPPVRQSCGVFRFTWCSGWEFKARISKKLNVASTCGRKCSEGVSDGTLHRKWERKRLKGTFAGVFGARKYRRHVVRT